MEFNIEYMKHVAEVVIVPVSIAILDGCVLDTFIVGGIEMNVLATVLSISTMGADTAD